MAALWTRDSLHDMIAERLAGIKFIAVSNREPYIHRFRGDQIECILPASGMATAIDPIMRASGGTWVAHGSGDADLRMVDANNHVAVPPADPSYTLRRVWLDSETENGFYMGLANECLWPLCHIVYHRPVFRLSDWEKYKRANEQFAEAVLEEAAGEPAFVFIQDYHFGLLPRIIKNRNPNLITAQFWHIPWPNRDAFRAFPWKEELIDGMLGNDLLGFHLQFHCSNFLDTVDRAVESIVDYDNRQVTRGGHVTLVRPFPISIDFESHQTEASRPGLQQEMRTWIERIGYKPEIIGAGIDRIDYTKGIPDRLAALDVLLEQQPELRGKLVFVQIAVPSRSAIGDYSTLDHQLDEQIRSLNDKWRLGAWEPVHYVREHCGQGKMIALHQMANFFVVSSLHDGMNLVAKEFVASRIDEQGVLILSRFTGAAAELTDAVLVNPFSAEDLALGMSQAIAMTAEEQTRRMQRLRTAVAQNNVYRWAGKLLSALLKIELPESREAEEIAAIAGSSHGR
jgi:trehalose-6-phosphate synthase